MKGIIISNESFYDKDHLKTFVNQDEYRFFAVVESSSTLVSYFEGLIKEVIGEKATEIFKDHPLSAANSEQIKAVCERELRKELAARNASEINGFAHRVIFGKDYYLDLKLNPNNDRLINDLLKITSIADECLKEKKPMYLSIK